MNVKMRVTVGDWYPDEQIAALAHIDALTAENERSRGTAKRHHEEAKQLCARAEVAEARLAPAEAENERLRAEETRTARQSADNFTARRAAESRLATAEGLLREIADRVGIPWGFGNLGTRFQAFLASSQPAAPAYRCGSCRDTGKWSNGIDCPNGCQPAAPARVVDGDGRYIVGGVKP